MRGLFVSMSWTESCVTCHIRSSHFELCQAFQSRAASACRASTMTTCHRSVKGDCSHRLFSPHNDVRRRRFPQVVHTFAAIPAIKAYYAARTEEAYKPHTETA